MTLDIAGETSLLLTREDVAPVHETHTAGSSPFLFTCDHYGRLLPKKLGDLGLPESELTRHIAWDIGIAGVAERLAELLDAHRVRSRGSLRRPSFPAMRRSRMTRPASGGARFSIPIMHASRR